MTNGATPGEGPPATYTAGPNPGGVPRRLSYASVASGATPQPHTMPARAGAFSHLSQPTPNNSYPPQYQPEYRHTRHHSGQEADTINNGSVPFGSTWRKPTVLPSYSRQFANMLGFGNAASQSSTSFFIPSYLRNSRYAAKLEAAHKARQATQRESVSGPSSGPPSLSTSSSTVNIQRMAPSHRGMTYDIIESHPPKEDDPTPLPSKWSDDDKNSGIDLTDGGLEVKYVGPSSKTDVDAAAVRANFPMSPQCGMFYYEVEIKNKHKEGMIAIGFSTQKASLERLPGWENESWAYHGDDGKTFYGESTGKAYGPQFSIGDIVGCGVNFNNGTAFFTKNGVYLEIAFRGLKNVRPFPSVGMKKHAGAMLSVNFGQRPFVFDIDGMMAREQRSIQQDILKAKVSTLHPPLDENALVQELVAHFLAHDGYVETAKAFAEELKAEKQALSLKSDDLMREVEVEDDVDAINRQRIRSSILEGDIDKALKHTNAYYPHVLEERPEIVFRLKCRKWVELIRKSTDLQSQQAYNKSARSTNGHSTVDDVFDQDMELDDQIGNVGDWDKMETEEVEIDLKYQELLREAMEYGQVLMREYADMKGEYRASLNGIFSLIAYDDAKASIHGHLLDPSGRVAVAEELNSAILVSLGRSSSAALERMYQQTEVLINEGSESGGPAAFVNLKHIFSA